MDKINREEANVSTDKTLTDIVRSIIDGRNVIIHGVGGVGKSFLIKHAAHRLRDAGYKVYVTATTGIAACGLSDPDLKVAATTLHRFAGIGTGELSVSGLISKVNSKASAKANWNKCEVLIIDEVSMLGKKLFQKLCGVAKGVRKNDSTPFGGIQLILSGDMLQLAPVNDDWGFKAPEWQEMNFKPFVLETPYRYEDMNFFNMLLRIRKAEHTSEDSKILRQRVRANQNMQKLLEELKDKNPADVIRPTMFFSRRIDVEVYNQEKLDALPGEAVEFVCKDEYISLSGKNTQEGMTPEDISKLMDDDMPKSVSFKVGSQVMLRINLDPSAKLVNGSRGVVTEIVPGEALIVKFLSGQTLRVDVHKRVIENKRFTASRTQIPFILADAMTIHKAQGSTLDYCVASLGMSIFCAGQAYVALSRCRTIQGLFLSEFVSSSIMADKEALAYSKYLEEKAKNDTL